MLDWELGTFGCLCGMFPILPLRYIIDVFLMGIVLDRLEYAALGSSLVSLISLCCSGCRCRADACDATLIDAFLG